MSLVGDVVALQAIDDEAASLRASLEEVQQRLQGSVQLEAARHELAEAGAALAAARREQRATEAEIESLTARIDPEEKRLYDGSVKSPKELSSIQHELDLLKQKRFALEDVLLENLTRLEGLEAEQQRAATAAASLEADWAQQRQSLEQQSQRLGALIASSDAKRAAQESRIEPRVLATYERVRLRRGGMAVARVQGGNCAGCRISLPEAIRKRAYNAETITQCPNCERILNMG